MKSETLDVLFPAVGRRLDKAVRLIAHGLDPTSKHRSVVYGSFRKGRKGRPRKEQQL